MSLICHEWLVRFWPQDGVYFHFVRYSNSIHWIPVNEAECSYNQHIVSIFIFFIFFCTNRYYPVQQIDLGKLVGTGMPDGKCNCNSVWYWYCFDPSTIRFLIYYAVLEYLFTIHAQSVRRYNESQLIHCLRVQIIRLNDKCCQFCIRRLRLGARLFSRFLWFIWTKWFKTIWTLFSIILI